MDTFKQLLQGPVWDSNVRDKGERERLVDAGLAIRMNGFTLVTPEGLKTADALGLLEGRKAVALGGPRPGIEAF